VNMFTDLLLRSIYVHHVGLHFVSCSALGCLDFSCGNCFVEVDVEQYVNQTLNM
jgi:hypothetical protein